ncbi:hypothetical protein C8J56DRAFT_1059148 [Mycena floridula]|nr:hypothetical protein C8J56DRAFT_1059148 [Mycena floridula]
MPPKNPHRKRNRRNSDEGFRLSTSIKLPKTQDFALPSPASPTFDDMFHATSSTPSSPVTAPFVDDDSVIPDIPALPPFPFPVPGSSNVQLSTPSRGHNVLDDAISPQGFIDSPKKGRGGRPRGTKLRRARDISPSAAAAGSGKARVLVFQQSSARKSHEAVLQHKQSIKDAKETEKIEKLEAAHKYEEEKRNKSQAALQNLLKSKEDGGFDIASLTEFFEGLLMEGGDRDIRSKITRTFKDNIRKRAFSPYLLTKHVAACSVCSIHMINVSR